MAKDEGDSRGGSQDIYKERVPHKFCPYCGARNEGNAEKCDSCGKDISWMKVPEKTMTVELPSTRPGKAPQPKRVFSLKAAIIALIIVLLLTALVLTLYFTTRGDDTDGSFIRGDAVAMERYIPGSASSLQVASPIRSTPNLQPLLAL